MVITDVVSCGVPYEGKLVIDVKADEIPLAPGDFKGANTAGFFKSCYIDSDDYLKSVGIGVDGNKYVSEKDPLNLNDDEVREYFGRQGVTDESVAEMFESDSDIPPIRDPRFSEYADKFSY